jgi:hypothetical protein
MIRGTSAAPSGRSGHSRTRSDTRHSVLSGGHDEGSADMDLELQGRTAVVIGGSSGIGAAAADVLAEEGCDVARDLPHLARKG